MKLHQQTFQSEILNREVTLYVLLPTSYESSDKFYPVIYMHDGQNLFFPEHSYTNSTWQVKETFEDRPDLPEVIVVGISSPKNETRLDEYCVDSFEIERNNGGKGGIYLDYITNKLKPYIDKTYRTIENDSAMLGSSMGGVISLYAAMQYGHVFSRIASLSGAFFVAPKVIEKRVKNTDFTPIKKLYMDTGDQEQGVGSNDDYLLSNGAIAASLSELIDPFRFRYEIIPGGTHDEDAWAKRFGDIVRYLFRES